MSPQTAPSQASAYATIARQAEALVAGEPDLIANLANLSALLWMELDALNWVGFYLVKENTLVLGPFQGQPACVRIPMGKGVCGTAALSGAPQIVSDVHQFPGHIACDSASNSELVLPIFVDHKVVAVLDLDSPQLARFKPEDLACLQRLLPLLESLNWG